MIKIAVFQKDGAWWFKWWNVAEPGAIFLKDREPWNIAGKTLAQNLDGPFETKQEAELARESFVSTRKEKYPWELFESE